MDIEDPLPSKDLGVAVLFWSKARSWICSQQQRFNRNTNSNVSTATFQRQRFNGNVSTATFQQQRFNSNVSTEK
jgi:hypothetical protein